MFALLTLRGSPSPMSQQLRMTSCDHYSHRARMIQGGAARGTLKLPHSSTIICACSLLPDFRCFVECDAL